MKTYLLRCLLILVLVLSSLPQAALAAPPEPEKPAEAQAGPAPDKTDRAALGKIEPLVMKELAQKGTTTYIVYLHEKADLRPAQRLSDKLSRRVAVVAALQETAQRSQAGIARYLDAQKSAGKVQEIKPYWIFNGLTVSGDRETVLALAARPEVERIQANHVRSLPVTAATKEQATADGAIILDDLTASAPAGSPSPANVEWNVAKVRANEVWDSLGITGQGVVVANIDTGVYYPHPALQRKYRGYNAGSPNHNYNWFDPTETYETAPDDGHGHGTHTMGTMVGSEANGSNRVGVAPGAQWVAVKAFTDGGNTSDDILHASFQWIIAPTNLAGQNPDPSKAPDIVSNSWGSEDSDDQTFWQDVLAVRAAGIMPVFAGGNNGPSASSVDSPGSFPQSLAVGATNINDAIATFSGRGPSPWGEIKPDISAPGVNVRSSVPPIIDPSMYEGGWNGTSMATPHGAGLTALIWQVRPDLTITATEFALTSTALPLPSAATSPNNDYGWGRLDAYQAVASILSGGRFWGRVTDVDDGLPVPGALIALVRQDGEGSQQMMTDARGYYTFTVAAGVYRASAGNFWYATQTVRNVEVTAGFTTILDFTLKSHPTGVLRGQVTGPSGPAPAMISLSGAPITVATSASGVYSLSLPAGVYDMRVRPATGLRHGSATGVSVVAGAETVRDFMLESAPRILLVDADAWSTSSRIGYYTGDLDDLYYSFDLWQVMTFTANLPPAATLDLYDVVVWHQPASSPGYIGAWPALSSYLDNGGRLFISGQDIGYWDDSGASRTYYRGYLHSQLVRDDADLRSLRGLRGDIFADIVLGLNAADSANNQSDPDAIAPISAAASAVFSYTTAITTGHVGGVAVDTGGYQVVYLAFGLEGAGAKTARQQTLSQALAWLSSPVLKKAADPTSAAAGDLVTFTLTLDNRLAAAFDDLRIEDALPSTLTYVEGSATGGLTYNSVRRRLEWQGSIEGEEQIAFSFSVRLGNVPGGASIANTAVLTARGATLPSSAQVLVSGPDLRTSRKWASDAVSTSGRVITYSIALTNTGVGAAMTTLTDPIPAGTTYVDESVRGGASYNAGLNRIEWAGILTATDPLAGQLAYATSDDVGGPAFSWIDISGPGTRIPAQDDTTHGPFDIGFPFALYGQTYTRFWVSSNGWMSFVEPSSSVYSNVCLPEATAPRALLAAWWDDLDATNGNVYYLSSSDSLIVSYVAVPRYSTGGPYTFQMVLRADGTFSYQYLDMRGTRLNEATVGVQDATGTRGLSVVCNQNYVHNNLAILFTPRGQPAVPANFSYRVRVNEGLPLQSVITNTALVASGAVTHSLAVTTTVNTVDLSTSTKTADRTVVSFGGSVTYTIAISNTGNFTATATLTDVLPAQVSYVNGSASGGAIYNPATRSILWSGPLAPGESSAIGFTAAFAGSLNDNTLVTNTVTIADPLGRVIQRAAGTRYRAADLSASRKEAAPAAIQPGGTVTFTVTVANGGGGPTGFVVTDALPAGVVYLPTTLEVGHGTVSFDPLARRLVWTGTTPGQHQTYLRFAVTIANSGVYTNTVQIQDNAGHIVERAAAVVVGGPTPTPTVTPTPTPTWPARIFLPIIMIDQQGD